MGTRVRLASFSPLNRPNEALTNLCLCLFLRTVGGVSDPGAHRGGQTEDPGLGRVQQLPDAGNHTPRGGTATQALTYRLLLCRRFHTMMTSKMRWEHLTWVSAFSGGQRSVPRLREHGPQRGRRNLLLSKNFFSST